VDAGAVPGLVEATGVHPGQRPLEGLRLPVDADLEAEGVGPVPLQVLEDATGGGGIGARGEPAVAQEVLAGFHDGAVDGVGVEARVQLRGFTGLPERVRPGPGFHRSA
jgi:hypothetical protein